MNMQTSPAALQGSTALSSGKVGEAPPKSVVLNQKQLLEIAIDALNKSKKEYFNAVHRIEDMSLDTFAIYSAVGTPFEPIANALNARGVATGMTLGGVTASLYPDLTAQEQKNKAHGLICSCHEDSDVIAREHVTFLLGVDIKKAR